MFYKTHYIPKQMVCKYAKQSRNHVKSNGDRIEVKLDATDGYDVTFDNPFEVSCDDETLAVGMFVYEDGYEHYVDAVEEDEDAELLDSGSKDGNEYIFWSYMDEEYNYAIMVDDSDTGVLLTSTVSEEAAKECFERLEISVDD